MEHNLVYACPQKKATERLLLVYRMYMCARDSLAGNIYACSS